MEMGSDGSITVTKKKNCGGVGSSITEVVLMDSSDVYLMELAGRFNDDDEEVFNNFVEHKFQQLDGDDQLDAGKLSVLKELDPSAAIADHHMRAALIRDHHHHLPAGHQGSTTTSPIVVILRMDGEDLLDFINSPRFEPEMLSIFTQIQIDMEMSTEDLTAAGGGGGGSLQLRDYLITMALQKLTVDHGMPPSSDSWVMSNIIEPALQFCSNHLDDDDEQEEQGPISDPRHFLEEFKRVAERLVEYLKQQPVIVAHTEITFDGSGIRKLLSNKSDLDKALDMALKELPPKDRNQLKPSKDYLCAVLDVLAGIIGLPPYGSVDQMDKVVDGVLLKMVMKEAEEEELKMLVRDILRSIMLEVEANPISVSSNSVILGPLFDHQQ